MNDALLPLTVTAAHATGDARPVPALACEAAEVEGAISAAEFRGALAYATTAVAAIATGGAAGIAGVTCSAVCSVCDTPPTMPFCVNRSSAIARVLGSTRADGTDLLVYCQCAYAETALANFR